VRWIRCDVNEHGPPTRGQLADVVDMVPKTVQFHLTGLAALGVVIPDLAQPYAHTHAHRVTGAIQG
jgi:predicted ArsR family transcriptional regulator